MKILIIKVDFILIIGRKVTKEEKEAFLECQICEMNECQFRSCFESSASSIFCNNHSDEFQGITTSKRTVSASKFMSLHSTLEDVFVSTTTTRYYNTDKSPSNNDMQQMSSNFYYAI